MKIRIILCGVVLPSWETFIHWMGIFFIILDIFHQFGEYRRNMVRSGRGPARGGVILILFAFFVVVVIFIFCGKQDLMIVFMIS